MSHGPDDARFFTQMVVAQLVKLACALPDEARRLGHSPRVTG